MGIECRTLFSVIFSAFLSIVLGTSATPAFAQSGTGLTTAHMLQSSTPLGLWEPMSGDSLLVDTRDNMGYLIHADGSFTAFDVVTGQRRVVRYIGRTYNAATPQSEWTMRSVHIKGDRMTYGKTGRFFRLYDEDGETAYGVHGYGNEDEIFGGDTRFRSMGCVIVREHILNVIERTYEMNGGALPVVTIYGLESLPQRYDISVADD